MGYARNLKFGMVAQVGLKEKRDIDLKKLNQ